MPFSSATHEQYVERQIDPSPSGQKRSGFKQLKNCLPQGSVLAPLLFNVYTADLPPTESRKFAYADDLALAIQHKDFHETERILTSDLAILAEYGITS